MIKHNTNNRNSDIGNIGRNSWPGQAREPHLGLCTLIRPVGLQQRLGQRTLPVLRGRRDRSRCYLPALEATHMAGGGSMGLGCFVKTAWCWFEQLKVQC